MKLSTQDDAYAILHTCLLIVGLSYTLVDFCRNFSYQNGMVKFYLQTYVRK